MLGWQNCYSIHRYKILVLVAHKNEQGQLSEEPEEHPQDNIIYCNTPEHEYTGKYLGSALYYNDIFVNGQKQNKE